MWPVPNVCAGFPAGQTTLSISDTTAVGTGEVPTAYRCFRNPKEKRCRPRPSRLVWPVPNVSQQVGTGPTAYNVAFEGLKGRGAGWCAQRPTSAQGFRPGKRHHLFPHRSQPKCLSSCTSPGTSPSGAHKTIAWHVPEAHSQGSRQSVSRQLSTIQFHTRKGRATANQNA